MRGFIYSQFVSDRRASEATRREEPPDLEPCNQREREENQNEKKLCVAAVSVITITAAFQSAADASQDVGRLVNAPLWQIARVIESPCVGEIWENNAPLLTVLQVIDGGVLATTRQSALDSEPRTKIIFVRTNRTYADGDALANGYYRATGTMSYQAVNGKIFVIDSDHRRLNQEIGLKSGQGFGSALGEKAEEIEEWLKLN